MVIKVLGTGCPKCQELEKRVQQALSELGLTDMVVEHVDDIVKITEYGVMSTPALVFDETVKAAGRIPEVTEIKSWLTP